MTVQWRDFSFVLLSDKDKIPRQAGIYMIADKTDSILYVGQTGNIYRRIVSHDKFKRFEEEPFSLYFLLQPGESKRLSIEDYLINKHRPSYNINKKRTKLCLSAKKKRRDNFFIKK